MTTPPLLIPTLRKGDPSCGACPFPGAPRCGEPAAWHVFWHMTPQVDFSLVCDLHMSWVQSQFVYIDRHPATVTCDMPGTGWQIADPSFCVIPPNEVNRE